LTQSQYNLFTRNRVEIDLADLHKNHGLGITVWSPLRSGLLAGRYNQGIPKNSRLASKGYEDSRKEVMGDNESKRLFVINQLNNYAVNELNLSMAELALAWCIKNKTVSTAIMGASHPLQIIQNYKCISLSKKLDCGILSQINDILLKN
jgi:aryl-alcohol dehydrogenase-like predicted oxidoreductase